MIPGARDVVGADVVAKPLPVPDERSEGFWQAAAKHVLAIQRCDACGHMAHPPAVVCPACLSLEARFTFTPVPPRGRLRTWTVMRDAFLPGFRGDIPWAIGDAELDGTGGVRLIARLAENAGTAFTLGAAVEVVFEDVAAGVALPVLRLVDR